ncbi:hypothetical protein [Sphingobacterium siyangense]|uniref:hypothetical protein n=1 Tax=Sphingobacterium siyangense TaxID=459529 RepID=UPI0019643AC1|nr:hypothetical protein [Sphingobacterium siyangense]QRY57292.1 hypothetical protein JVX97_25410 [Sphingobacterium siyangense]
MWSLILYFLFGIGQPSNAQPSAGTPTVQSADTPPPNPGNDDGDGGDVVNPRPPKK